MSALTVKPSPAVLEGHASAALVVELQLTNTGAVAGTEVVQVYCVDPIMAYVRPWKRLLTFTRVSLDAGATVRVHLVVSPEQLAFQDDSSPAGAWRVVAGGYQIRVGPSSVEATLSANVTIAV